MKIFALLAICLFTFALGEDSNESKSLEEKDVQEIAEFLGEKFNITIISDMIRLAKIAKDKCPDVEAKLESAADEIVECITDIELGSETFCSLIRHNWAKCAKPGFDAVASCLPKESKDLPYMAGKILFAIVDEACNSTIEQILELFNPCGDTDDLEDVPECSGIAETFTSHKDKLPSKSLVCSLIPKWEKCVKVQDKTSCKNPITVQATNQFYEAINDSIKDDCDKENEVSVLLV